MDIKASVKHLASMERKFEDYEKRKASLLASFSKLIQTESGSIGLKKDTSNLFKDPKHLKPTLDLRHFNHVLNIDSQNMVAEIEGMATYETIVAQTLKLNCLPTVVPELKSITIGGALAGVAIESSSFRYGLVHESILEYEILLGNGQIILCRPDNEYKDLFYAFPNSYGTLGYALKVKVQLIPVKEFVKLTHRRFTDSAAFFKHIETSCLENKNIGSTIAYIDGTIFTPNEMFVTTAEFVNSAPFLSDYKFMNIYYRSIKRKREDYLTISDYIWRWDPDWFWCSKNFFMESFLMRLLFGGFMLKSTTFGKIRKWINQHPLINKIVNAMRRPSETIIQDVQIPIKGATNFYDFFQKEIKISPIWICPIITHPSNHYNFYPMKGNQLYINFGFWDFVPSQESEGFYNRKVEKMVKKLKGNKSLYSKIYYTENEFWEIYDQSLYNHLKSKYDPNQNLKSYFQKVSSE